MRRTQITLSDDQYATLKRRSREEGLSLAELVRRAVVQAYPEADGPRAAAIVRRTAGAWEDRDGRDGAAIVEELRGADRLAR